MEQRLGSLLKMVTEQTPFKLVSSFRPCGDQPSAIESLTNAFKTGAKHQTLLGVTGSGKTFTMANVIKNLGKKTLVLAHNKTLAAQLYAEFKEFFPDNAVEYFVSYYDYYQPEAYVPGRDIYIEKDASVNDEIDRLRHKTTRSLLERDDVIVVASVSCIYGIGSPDEYKDQRIMLFTNEVLDRDEFLKNLVIIQYQRNDVDFERGSFRVRGDIVEVFPSHEDAHVVRIEFFDDIIESLSLVDPLRGSIVMTLSKVTIFPKSHYVVSKERLEAAIKNIQSELRGRLQQLKREEKLVEAQRLEQRTLLDIEMLEEMGFCSGIENYSRHLTGTEEGMPPPTLIDFFKKDFFMIVDESHITISQVGGMYRGDRARKENLVNYGFRLPSALDNRPLKFKEFEKKIDKILYVSATPRDYEYEQSAGRVTEQILRPTGLLDPTVEVRKADTQVDDLLMEVKKTIKDNHRVLITTLTKKLAEELTHYYKSLGIRIRYLHSDIKTLERTEILHDLRSGKFDVLVGINLLREGLDIPEVSLIGILDADKEGFLRSHRSLIQTMGRAARNALGRVILYAYKETKSMAMAMEETSRRRKIQEDYNKKHSIIPQTVSKKISGGIIETLRGRRAVLSNKKKDFLELHPEKIDDIVEELRTKMKRAARELRFEDAASIRDEIKELKEARFAF